MTRQFDKMRPPELGAPYGLSAEIVPFSLPWQELRPGVFVWLESQTEDAHISGLLSGIFCFAGVIGLLSAMGQALVPVLGIHLSLPILVMSLLASGICLPLWFVLLRWHRKAKGRVVGLSMDTLRRMSTCERVGQTTGREFSRSETFASTRLQVHPVRLDKEQIRAFALVAHVGDCAFVMACQFEETSVLGYADSLPPSVRELVGAYGPELSVAANIRAGTALMKMFAVGQSGWKSG